MQFPSYLYSWRDIMMEELGKDDSEFQGMGIFPICKMLKETWVKYDLNGSANLLESMFGHHATYSTGKVLINDRSLNSFKFSDVYSQDILGGKLNKVSLYSSGMINGFNPLSGTLSQYQTLANSFKLPTNCWENVLSSKSSIINLYKKNGLNEYNPLSATISENYATAHIFKPPANNWVSLLNEKPGDFNFYSNYGNLDQSLLKTASANQVTAESLKQVGIGWQDFLDAEKGISRLSGYSIKNLNMHDMLPAQFLPETYARSFWNGYTDDVFVDSKYLPTAGYHKHNGDATSSFSLAFLSNSVGKINNFKSHHLDVKAYYPIFDDQKLWVTPTKLSTALLQVKTAENVLNEKLVTLEEKVEGLERENNQLKLLMMGMLDAQDAQIKATQIIQSTVTANIPATQLPTDEQWLAKEDVMSLLKISERTLYRYQDKFKPGKIGSKLMFRKSIIDAEIANFSKRDKHSPIRCAKF